ncbi:MAG: ArsR/SmtB family transcription factor [Haloarculaceae archaeon]
MSLLPSKPDTSAADDAEPRVVGVESDDADRLLSALSSGTARRLLAELHEEPSPPGNLADRVDTSLQNVQYHLENLEEAGAVQVVDTVYSEKGREMDVYAPADQPLVIFAGNDNESTSIRTALTRLLGGFGALALASVVVQSLFGDGPGLFGAGGAPGGGADGGAAATPTVEQVAAAKTPSPAEYPAGTVENVGVDAATRAGDAAASATGLEPGLVFFLGGATVMLGAFALWYAGR